MAFAKAEFSLSLSVGSEGNFSAKLERFLETGITQHGRWAFDVCAQEVIHIAGYPPTAPDERKYQLMELDSMVIGIESLSEDLCRLLK